MIHRCNNLKCKARWLRVPFGYVRVYPVFGDSCWGRFLTVAKFEFAKGFVFRESKGKSQ